MGHPLWLSVLPPLFTIVLTITSRKIIPSLFGGVLMGALLISRNFIGTFETTIDYILKMLTDAQNVQVLLFLYLFSALMYLINKSGGVQAFAGNLERLINHKSGVLFTLWALIPISFIDCGFRVVSAGSILKPLVRRHHVSRERTAFMLNNTASPIVELIPIATTFVGFNINIIGQALQSAGVQQSAYRLLLGAIPLEFFNIAVILITFISIFVALKKKDTRTEKGEDAMMHMDKEIRNKSVLQPRMINLLLPLAAVIALSFFFYWLLGSRKAAGGNIQDIITSTEPNKAMLLALLITLIGTAILFVAQKYPLKDISADIISGGNRIVSTLAILVLAWPLSMMAQKLGLSEFIQQSLGNSLPKYILPASIFAVSAAVSYFIGSSWGTAALIMPIAIPLAAGTPGSLVLAIAAVFSGVSFGDVTSPLSGMTNMASNITGADHIRYIKYAAPFNFIAAAVALALYIAVPLLQT